MEESDVDTVVEGLIKNNNLASLVDTEAKLFKKIRMLNSEFHTLLYENYSKLIGAAQIIGKMSSNFDGMESDINSLSENMDEIIKQSDHLSFNLSDKFGRLSKLSNTYHHLRKLQFASDLEDLVLSNGQKLAQKLMVSIEEHDWTSEQKPRHVRPVVIEIIDELSALSENLSHYCEEGPHIELTGQHSLYHRSNPKTSNPLMNNIKKLFSERIEIFEPVKFQRRTILFGIVKIMLRAMVESVRLELFNKNGIQQLQIDAKYLQHELSRFVSNENIVFALLDEAVTSAEIRCLDD